MNARKSRFLISSILVVATLVTLTVIIVSANSVPPTVPQQWKKLFGSSMEGSGAPPFPIDAVITWVDSRDQRWRNAYNAVVKHSRWTATQQEHTFSYNTSEAAGRAPPVETVFAPVDELFYVLHGMAKNTPWLRRVTILTARPQVPPYLEDIRASLPFPVAVVHHDEDIIPRSGLPTFSSNVIEPFLHRVPGLSEHFLYFNDDIIPIAPLQWSHFFAPNGAVLYPQRRINMGMAPSNIWKSQMLVTGRALQEKANVQAPNRFRHMPYPMRCSRFERMHELFAEEIAVNLSHPVRAENDVIITVIMASLDEGRSLYILDRPAFRIAELLSKKSATNLVTLQADTVNVNYLGANAPIPLREFTYRELAKRVLSPPQLASHFAELDQWAKQALRSLQEA